MRAAKDVAAAWQYAESAGRVRGSRVIVEGFIAFDYEITQLTVRAQGAGGDVETHPARHLFDHRGDLPDVTDLTGDVLSVCYFGETGCRGSVTRPDVW